MVRTCGLIIHAAYFQIRFYLRLLAVPLKRQNFGSAPLFFCRRRPLATKLAGRRGNTPPSAKQKGSEVKQHENN